MSYSARNAALNILCEVCDHGYLNLVGKKYLPLLKKAEDRRFCTALVSTTVENLYRIDYVLETFTTAKRIQKVVKNILRLGVCQLMFFESVPQSAAVNESVRLCQKCGKSQLKGFVNGVLRSVANNLGSMEYPSETDDPARYLSVLYSYPKWLCEKYLDEYGFAFTQDMLAYRAEYALTCVRVRKDRHKDWLPGRYCADAAYIRNASAIEEMPQYRSGALTVMSEASMLCVTAADLHKDDRVLDVCAAPGGKTAYAAEKCKSVLSTDLHAHRVQLIEKNIRRLHLDNVQTMQMDACIFQKPIEEQFDVVLCDVPCSALGLLYRKPDIKIHKQPEDLEALVEIQQRILDVCSRYVRPGGKLIYSTCTINAEENERNIQTFLNTHAGFAPDDFSGTLPETLRPRIKTGLQLFPHLDGVDGFYIARLKRK